MQYERSCINLNSVLIWSRILQILVPILFFVHLLLCYDFFLLLMFKRAKVVIQDSPSDNQLICSDFLRMIVELQLKLLLSAFNCPETTEAGTQREALQVQEMQYPSLKVGGPAG